MVFDNDGFVGHGGDVGAAGSAGTHDDGELGNAQGGHYGDSNSDGGTGETEGVRKRGSLTARLIVEDATEVVAVGEDIGLVREICAARIDEVDAGQT